MEENLWNLRHLWIIYFQGLIVVRLVGIELNGGTGRRPTAEIRFNHFRVALNFVRQSFGNLLSIV